MRWHSGALRIGCAAGLGLVLSACTLSADLDRLKGDAGEPPQDAGAEEPPKLCEKGLDCTGCGSCASFCACAAAPTAYDVCVKQCLEKDN